MQVNFEKFADKLAPAIVQDAQTAKVLMLGYMNAAAFEKTRNEKLVTFFSRSRQKLWTKGETSGNFLRVEQILIDCDSDAILIKAIPTGAVCHTGADACFNEANENGEFLFELEKIVQARQKDLPENSYTAKLFEKGMTKISQKVGEEAIEIVIAALAESDEHFKNEAADLLYHLIILLAAKNTNLNAVSEILRSRHQK